LGSFESSLGFLDLVETLLLVKGNGSAVRLSGLTLLLNELSSRVFTDSFVSFSIHILNLIRGDTSLDESRELLLVTFLIFFFEVFHVFSDVNTVDVVTEEFIIVGLGLDIETRETVTVVGDEDTTIGSTLHGTEDTSTSGGTSETDIEESLERTRSILSSFDQLNGTIGLSETFVLVSKTELGKSTTGKEETSSISRSPVGQTTLDTVTGKFVSIGSREDEITLELGVDDLANNILVGETDDQSVLGRVVLVLGLNDESLTSIVVGLTLYIYSVLDRDHF
jgi:hypothetical protein